MKPWLYQKLSDAMLIRAYAQGQMLAFECLYNRHKSSLFSFVLRQCNDRQVSEEIAQDVWMAIVKSADNYQATAKFSTWLFQIAHNRLVDHWRKVSRTRTVFIDPELVDFTATEYSFDDIQHQQELKELIALVNKLPVEQFETLLLKIEGFSRNDIALITNTNQETVKSRLRYAKNFLRGNRLAEIVA